MIMDWGFLNIFKNADFDKLMAAAALAGWAFYYYYPEYVLAFGLALLCTIYCLLGFIVYVYNWLFNVWQKRKDRKKEIEIRKYNDQAQHLKAQFVFDRLGTGGQQILSNIVKIGKKSTVSGTYLLSKYDNMIIISQLSDILYSDEIVYPWVKIEETIDSYCITLKWPLNEIIEEKNK